MSDKILVILSTAETMKALTGIMYATNTVKHGWMSDVKVLLFGPIEIAVFEDEDLQVAVRDMMDVVTPVACKVIADNEKISTDLKALGADVQYVGPIIADLIKDGYTPLVF